MGQSCDISQRKSTDAIAACASFQTTNRSVRGFSVASQASYELNLLNQSRDCPKLLHSYIRDKKTARPSVGPIRLCSGELTDDPRAMAEAFASSFSSVYTKEALEHPAPHQTYNGTMGTVTFSQNRVQKALQLLDTNTSAGPDNLHPVLLKHCAACLAYPLHIIFLRDYSEGHLPSSWKSSLVIPIFKKGERFDALNYRPISTTSVCSKTFERLLCEDLANYLQSNNILSPHQFGFRAHRSTMDQLLMVYDSVSKSMDRGRCH